MAKKTAPPPPPPPEREPSPMEIEVKIHSIHTSGSTLANASVTLGGCFAVRGVKVMNSEKGAFVSMPGYRFSDGYKDVCFPCTPEFHKRFQQTVLTAYRQELTRLHEPQTYERPRQREKPAFEERAAPGPQEEVPPERPEEAPAGPEEEGHTLGGMAMQ